MAPGPWVSFRETFFPSEEADSVDRALVETAMGVVRGATVEEDVCVSFVGGARVVDAVVVVVVIVVVVVFVVIIIVVEAGATISVFTTAGKFTFSE